MSSADELDTRVARGVCLDTRRTDRAMVASAVIDPGSALSLCAAVWVPPEAPAIGDVAVYLLRPEGTGTVPVVSWELRANFGGKEAEVVTGLSGTLSGFTAWTSEGSVAFAGRVVLGWELWASHNGVTPIPCGVRFIVRSVAHGGGGQPYAVGGELV